MNDKKNLQHVNDPIGSGRLHESRTLCLSFGAVPAPVCHTLRRVLAKGPGFG